MEATLAELEEAVDHLDATIHLFLHGTAKRILDNGQDLEALQKMRDDLNFYLVTMQDKYLGEK